MSVNNSFNAARDLVTVYSPEGEAKQFSRLNARELVAEQGWSFGGPKEAPAEPAQPEAPVAEPEPEPQPEPEAALEPEAPATIDHLKDPLAEIAAALTGSDDVAKYLEGFTPDNLRIMAEERYGEKVHARTGKDKVIEKIIGWEEEKLASLNDE